MDGMVICGWGNFRSFARLCEILLKFHPIRTEVSQFHVFLSIQSIFISKLIFFCV